MTNVNNTSNINETEAKAKKSLFTHGVFNLKPDSSVRSSLLNLNSNAYEVSAHELNARQATYRYVASLVDAANDYNSKSDVAAEFNSVFSDLFGDPKEGDQNANPYLRLVRAADGEWATEKGRNGGFIVKWKHNRSGEKYAAVCRFAVKNAYSGKDLLTLIESNRKIQFLHNGETHFAEPTINGIVAADRKQHQSAPRAVLDGAQMATIKNLAPLASIQMTAGMAALFAGKEEGLALATVVVSNGQLHIVGDSGKEGNEVQRLFKKQFIEPKDNSTPTASIPSASIPSSSVSPDGAEAA